MAFEDDDAMFQDAAQSLIDAGNNGGQGNNTDDGGMPGADAGTNTEQTNDEADAAATNDTTTQQQEQAAPAAAALAVATPAIEAINYEGISGGLIKTPEDITRIAGEHRTMQTELETLRDKVKLDPFANEFVKALNQMHADGKTADQISTFIRLQDLGDISKLAPLDAMVQARVLRDGRDAEIVKTMLERKYEITAGMDDLDRRIAEEKMLDDAKADYEYLKNEKKELATPTQQQASAEAADAAVVITQDEIRAQVKPITEKIKEQFSSLGEVNLNGKFDKDGKPTADAILFDLPIPNEFKEKIPELLESYFIDSNTPVNKDTLETAMGILQYQMFNQFGVKIIQDAVSHASSVVEKRIRAEYENNKPEKRERVHQPINATELTDAQLESYVSGE